MWQFASATQYNFTMLDIDTSDVSLNSYYDLDKGIVDVHANACFQGAALRLPGPRPPRAMHSPPLPCCCCREVPAEETGRCPSPAAQLHSAAPERAQGTAGVPRVGSQSSRKAGPIGQHKSILVKKPTVNPLCKTEKGTKEKTTAEGEI